MESSTLVENKSVLILARHEATLDFFSVEETIAVLVQRIEDHEYFVRCDVLPQRILYAELEVIGVDTPLLKIETAHELIHIADVEVRSYGQLASLFF